MAKESVWVWVRVIGGPAARPYIVPNSALKRGFSVRTIIRWRLPKPLRALETVNGAHYRLVTPDGGAPYYLHVTDPNPEVERLRRMFPGGASAITTNHPVPHHRRPDRRRTGDQEPAPEADR